MHIRPIVKVHLSSTTATVQILIHTAHDYMNSLRQLNCDAQGHITAKGLELLPAKDEALVHLVGVNDALQHPGLQTLHCLGKTFWGVDVGPDLVEGMGLVCGGGGVGLQPGAVLMGVQLHTHMVNCIWHILLALHNASTDFFHHSRSPAFVSI